MTPAFITAIVAVVAALGVAGVAGVLHNRRSGVVRETESPDVDVSDLGLSRTGPTIVHFSAVWCGPCASVRRVVNQVCADLHDVAHVEIDMDANPAAARKLSVMSSLVAPRCKAPQVAFLPRESKPRGRARRR